MSTTGFEGASLSYGFTAPLMPGSDVLRFFTEQPGSDGAFSVSGNFDVGVLTVTDKTIRFDMNNSFGISFAPTDTITISDVGDTVPDIVGFKLETDIVGVNDISFTADSIWISMPRPIDWFPGYYVEITVVFNNNPPAFTTSATFTVDENQTALGLLQADDLDGDVLSYTIVGGADAALFAVDPTTGALSFIRAPDFEAPGSAAGTNFYAVEVEITDGVDPVKQTFTVEVLDVYEAPPANTPPSFTTTSPLSIDENETVVGTIVAHDPEGDALIYSVSGGDDAALFSVDARTGELSFKRMPDFERPGSAAGTNAYQVEVSVSDGQLTTAETFEINVGDVDETLVTGTLGNDQFSATDAPTHFDGLSGQDSVTFSGQSSEYAIEQGPHGMLYVTGPYGTDTLSSIERLQFDDGTLAVDTDGTAGQMFRLYQAVFGRVPDTEGLDYWVRHQDASKSSFEDVARSFMASPEFAQRFGSDLSSSDFLKLLYQNVLGRKPDGEGFTYWVDKLDTGQTNYGDLLAFFSDSKENIAGTAGAMSEGIWLA